MLLSTRLRQNRKYDYFPDDLIEEIEFLEKETIKYHALLQLSSTNPVVINETMDEVINRIISKEIPIE